MSKGSAPGRDLRYVAVDDGGRVLNPWLMTGQILGGISQGIREVLYEEVLYEEVLYEEVLYEELAYDEHG